jgi:hypothetical protein
MPEAENTLYMHKLMQRMAKKPSIMLAALGIYAGMGLMYLGERKLPLSEFLQEFGWQSIGGLVIAISTVYLMSAMLQLKKEERFIDVDDKRKSSSDSTSIDKLVREIENLKKSQPDIDYAKIEELISKSTEKAKVVDSELVKSFESYFNGLRSTLEEKVSIADEKASILLDKGTAYSKGGITFFILSIVIWQILAWLKGFEPQFIYGIVSCSVLFIFIEFLSAWFLKQYRQFVDTSTYLIKVKSIFDKYMLSYLVLKEASGEEKEKLLSMLDILKEDIKWPETYLLKNSDVSFAKETLETMSYLLKNMKETTKEAADKK